MEYVIPGDTLRGRYRDFTYAPYPHRCIVSPIMKSPTRVVHLLQLINLHLHTVIMYFMKASGGTAMSKIAKIPGVMDPTFY